MSHVWINIGGTLTFLLVFVGIINFVAYQAGYYKTRGGKPVYIKRHYIVFGLLVAIILVSMLAEKLAG